MAKAKAKLDLKIQPLIDIADDLMNKYYKPLDYETSYEEAMGRLPEEMRGLMDVIQAEGDRTAMRYRGLLTETSDIVAPAARKAQDMVTAQWQQALSSIDPNWRSRLKGSQDSTDALVDLANKYLTGEEASDLVATGIAQSKRAQEITSDMLAGKLSAADQRAMDIRTAETAQKFGQWGGAGAGMAAGTRAAEGLISSQNLMMKGIMMAPQAGGAVTGAFSTLAGINQIGGGAVAQQQALSAQYMGPQLDVLGMYNQTLGALAQYQTTPGQAIAQMASGTYGAGIQTGIAEMESNVGQKMSWFSGGLNLGTDVQGAMMQAAAARKAASASQSAGMMGGIGSAVGGIGAGVAIAI